MSHFESRRHKNEIELPIVESSRGIRIASSWSVGIYRYFQGLLVENCMHEALSDGDAMLHSNSRKNWHYRYNAQHRSVGASFAR